MANEIKVLVGSVLGVGSLAAVTLTSLAVIGGFKASGTIDNATADQFISGMKVAALFVGVIMLAIIGKTVQRMFMAND
jgi:hypothetical protein